MQLKFKQQSQIYIELYLLKLNFIDSLYFYKTNSIFILIW